MFAIRLWKIVAVAVAMFAATLVSGAEGGWTYGGATVTEYVQLPKFCWSAFENSLVGPEFNIPPGCGVGSNHYCYGLLDLMRAKKAKTPAQKRPYLSAAKTNTVYTLSAFKREGLLATCPITAHAEGTMREIDLQYKIFGIK